MSNPTELEMYWMAVKSDFKTFMLQSFKQLYPKKDFLDNWHIDAIIHFLEQSMEGKKRRLILNLPPRHLKSFITSVVLPAFIIGRDPAAQIICVSYSDELATTLARDFRRIIESQWYKQVFPKVEKLKLTGNDFVTSQGGFRYATSVGGTITGKGGEIIIIDDPIKPADAQSEKLRQAINDWYNSTLLSRLEDKGHSILILVMQRLHVYDLTGHIEGESGFSKLSLPAIARKTEDIPIGDGKFYTRPKGEVLHEAKESLAVINQMRQTMGKQFFAAQYQQAPESPDGALFKKKYFKIIDELYKIKPGGTYWVSIDAATSTAETADYSAICYGYSNEDGHYLLKAERGRWDFEELRDKALFYAKNMPDITYMIEGASVGIALFQYIKKHTGYRCLGYVPKRSKFARAAFVLPIFEQGRVHICRPKKNDEWVDAFLNEMLTFPHCHYDDQVDCLVQIVDWAERWVNPGGRFYSFRGN